MSEFDELSSKERTDLLNMVTLQLKQFDAAVKNKNPLPSNANDLVNNLRKVGMKTHAKKIQNQIDNWNK